MRVRQLQATGEKKEKLSKRLKHWEPSFQSRFLFIMELNETRWQAGERLHGSEIQHHSSALGPLIIKAAIYFLWQPFFCEVE